MGEAVEVRFFVKIASLWGVAWSLAVRIAKKEPVCDNEAMQAVALPVSASKSVSWSVVFRAGGILLLAI